MNSWFNGFFDAIGLLGLIAAILYFTGHLKIINWLGSGVLCIW